VRGLRVRCSLDVAGRYAQPDIFSLTVNGAVMAPATFSD
jgi:hypothetical protein